VTLHIHLLGPAQIRQDEVPIDISGHRPLALLAYLLVTGKAHTRQHLIDLLFEGPDDPRAALRWTLTKLREAIGADYVLADRQEVAFNFESDYWLDVAAFEAGQIELYRGDLLEGLHLRDAYAFEDWLLFQRERLRGHYQAALERLLAEQENRGDSAGAVETAHQLLQLDNLREEWHRALIHAYARLGKREAALAQYAQCRQVLEAELGVDPAEETVALAEAIQKGFVEPKAATPTGPGLPPKPPFRRGFPTSLVGRAAEMEALRRVWQAAAAGSGHILLIQGEPGIGKTRLAEELLGEVGHQAAILRAKCPETQDPLAYTLFVDPLRQALAGERPPGVSDTWLAEVARLLPELRDRYPHLPQPAPLDPAAERRRLFDAVCATLLALAGQRPLVLFLDDLQWADATSLEVLNHFSGWITQAPVLVLGAYRPHEVEGEHPLLKGLNAWRRAGLLTGLALQALSQAAVDALLQELTTWSGDDPSFGDLIYRETAGNPLFVVETLASLRDEGRLPQSAAEWRRDFRTEAVTIPPGVQMIIEARLNRLDEVSRQIVTAAAVMRGSFEVEVVQSVSGRSEWETLEGLERLLAGGLLVEQGQDEFTFSHDKIRAVAYQGLSLHRRKLLHRRAAETQERWYRGREQSIAGRLAYHYELAGVQEKALDYHIQAAQAAKEQYALEAATAHYQKAVTLAKARGDYEQAARLSMQAGLAYHQALDFEGARQAYQESFALPQQAGRGEPATPLPAAPHPLRLTEWEPESLDPALVSDTSSAMILHQLFSGLVEESPDVEIAPAVAQCWEILEGGQRYIFHLRPDVAWSDGTPLTAADFEYAWRRVLHPSIPVSNASMLYDVKGARAFHLGQIANPDEVGVRALDQHTLAIELERPAGYLLHLLTHPVVYPVPCHVVEARGAAWTAVEHIVSNGPFRLEAWQKGEFMRLARNPAYYGRFGGNVERVEVRFGLDRAAELAWYDAGRLDIAHLPLLQREYAQGPRAAEHISVAGRTTIFALLDSSCPPLDDPRVRRAFVLAADRQTWTLDLLGKFGSPATGGFIPPGMPGHSAGIGLPYDPAEARRLLAEAGYPGGQDFPVMDWLIMAHAESLADYLEAQWRTNLGIRLGRKSEAVATFIERAREERPPMLLGGCAADYPDPDDFLRVAVHEFLPGWRNETYAAWIEQAGRLTDQGQRIKLYQQADRILIEEAIFAPLLYGRWRVLVKPWVKQFALSASRRASWKDVVIERHE
jgi:ABC-type oligopeptide transport system substrate-binding subunit/DNA-binding SARP family transcriptional activator